MQTLDSRWVYRVGAIAALLNVAVIIVQIVVFTISPPPETVNEWFTLLQDQPLLGMLNLDLLYLVNNALVIPMYFALYIVLRQRYEVSMLLALLLGIAGMAAYMPTNTAFEMLRLTGQYTSAITESEQTIALAAGQALVLKYYGSAFVAYYVLNAIALLMFAAVLLRSAVFGKSTAYAALAAGILMIVPSTFGAVGLIFAFLSLIPWTVFSVLLARHLLRLARDPAQVEITGDVAAQVR